MANKDVATKPEPGKKTVLTDVRSLARILRQHDLTEIEVETEDSRIRISRTGTATTSGHPPAASLSPLAAQSAPAPVKEEVEQADATVVVTTPFVGTFYRAATPESDPFVEEGQQIKRGQTLCIVEAMKLMNEIESDVEGRIVEILVNNGDPVEYGQALFRVQPL